jgi:hypothetical protein
MTAMKDLIEALTILLKYGDPYAPTHCEHDVLHVYCGVDPALVSDADRTRLDELSFTPSDEGGFYSFRFGSC